MVRISSQIGMACAVMERPQESAIKPVCTQRLVKELFPLTIKVQILVLHH